MPRKLELLDRSDFRHAYFAGRPEAEIARQFRVDRDVVRRWILEAGYRPRSKRYANQFLAEERPLALKRAQTAAARLAALTARRLYREKVEERACKAAQELLERADGRRRK
jgi:transposase